MRLDNFDLRWNWLHKFATTIRDWHVRNDYKKACSKMESQLSWAIERSNFNQHDPNAYAKTAAAAGIQFFFQKIPKYSVESTIETDGFKTFYAAMTWRYNVAYGFLIVVMRALIFFSILEQKWVATNRFTNIHRRTCTFKWRIQTTTSVLYILFLISNTIT